MRPPGAKIALHRWRHITKKRAAAYEIDANRRDVALRVGVIGKAQQQTRLSNPGVADQQKLEEIVVFRVHVSNDAANRGGQRTKRLAGWVKKPAPLFTGLLRL